MQRMTTGLLIAATFGLSACAGTGASAKRNEPGATRVQRAGLPIVLTPDQAAQGIYAVVPSSPGLTQWLRQQLTQAGFKTADKEPAAGLVWKVVAGYSFAKPGLVPTVVDYGRAYELALAGRQPAALASVPIGRAELEAAKVDPADAGPLGAMVGAAIKVHGIGEKVNIWLTGDPRGWCLAMCDKRDLYQQEGIWAGALTAAGASRPVDVRTVTFDGSLRPAELIEQSLQETLRQMRVAQ